MLGQSYGGCGCASEITEMDWGACALSLIVRDLRNGVSRLESAEIIGLAQAEQELALSGRLPLQSPLSCRLNDLLLTGLYALGVGSMLPAESAIRGCAHVVACDLTHYVLRRVA